MSDTQGWRRRLSLYQRPNDWRGVFELAVTVLPLGLAWLGMVIALRFHLYWLYGFLLFPAAGFLLRLFLIQHDCGHGAFFGSAAAEPLGWPPDRRADADPLRSLAAHSRHSSCDLRQPRSPRHGRHQHADVRRVSAPGQAWGRLSYRLYRHPAVMFGLGPAYVFFLEQSSAVWLDAQGMDALGQHDIDQRSVSRPALG